MHSLITQGVEIRVETFYQAGHSNPLHNEYLFAYQITIENHNSFPVKLINRHWHIFDSIGDWRQVEGPGVIGQQPVIEAGQSFTYMSSCNLRSELGKMHGTYEMLHMHSRQTFLVDIPSFELVAPLKFN